MGTDPDQLPVLQHLLMRMWTWQRAGPISQALQLYDDPLIEQPRSRRGDRPCADVG